MKETNFKQTDIGTIPKDWVVKKFSDIFESVGVRGYQLKTNEYCQSGKTIIIDQGKENIVGYSNKPHPIICHEKGLIIFGDHTRIFKLIKDNFFVGADGVQVLQCIKDNTSFIYYYCLTLDIPNTGYNRHFKYLKDATFILPPTIAEQRAIAEALTSIDDLISSLNSLIDKKKNIKQGTMQQLLTAKLRLKGFNKDWVVKKFSDIFESVGVRGYQLKTNEYCQSGKTIIIDQGKENIVGYSNKPHPIICHEKGLIIFGDHTRIFKLIKDNFFVGADGVQVLQCIKDNTSFIYYYCLTLDIPNTGYNRHFKYLKDATFILPPTIAEQRAIAEILTTMDEEINMLEEKKAKYQEIKQGMMQQLLTGKIRLID